MYRTFVILRHTFLEAIVQPIYSLLLALGAADPAHLSRPPAVLHARRRHVMYKSVGLDVMLLLVLVATLFATSKSIYEEIEDRTMLTLMSKPVCKVGSAGRQIPRHHPLGAAGDRGAGNVLILRTWWRIRPTTATTASWTICAESDLRIRLMNLAGLVPSLVLIWLQISVLAAIGVAISTRVSLVVNLPGVILIYFAGNLTRFLSDAPGGPLEGRGPIVNGLASVVKTVIPYLENFDLRQRPVYSHIKVPGTVFMNDINAVSMGSVIGYTGYALLYAIAYSALALSIGLLLFQSANSAAGKADASS